MDYAGEDRSSHRRVDRGEETAIQEDRIEEVHRMEDRERLSIVEEGCEVKEAAGRSTFHEEHIALGPGERQEVEGMLRHALTEGKGQSPVADDGPGEGPENDRIPEPDEEILLRVLLRSQDRSPLPRALGEHERLLRGAAQVRDEGFLECTGHANATEPPG